VKVHVKYRLVSHRAVVLQHVELLYPCDGSDRAAKAGEHAPDRGGGVIRKLVESGGFFLWNDEGMAVAQGPNIEESQHMLVLVDLVARDVPPENLGENRVRHGAELIRSNLGRLEPWAFTDGREGSKVPAMKNLASVLFLALSLTLACGGDGTEQVFSADPPLVLDEDERPAMVTIPSDYDPSTSYPLLILLHGRGATGQLEAIYLRMFDVIDAKQFVFVYPDGISNAWNATEACCDLTGEVDDVGYISRLIDEAQGVYNIDAERVYLMGHSNGGFMSFRMACERSDLITAIVSLAGSTFNDPADCQPATLPVSALAVHGTDDETIPYEGSMNGAFSFPGAVETVERFAARAGCNVDSPAMLESINLTGDDVAETERVAYTIGCDEGTDFELWTIEGGPHIPVFIDTEWATRTTDWLLRHSR